MLKIKHKKEIKIKKHSVISEPRTRYTATRLQTTAPQLSKSTSQDYVTGFFTSVLTVFLKISCMLHFIILDMIRNSFSYIIHYYVMFSIFGSFNCRLSINLPYIVRAGVKTNVPVLPSLPNILIPLYLRYFSLIC